MAGLEFRKEQFDIVTILNSTIAVGVYRGHETWTALQKVMDTIPDGTLILIDLRRVIWFHSAFCEPAFGPVFEALKDHKWRNKYLVFQIPYFHKTGFFQGVLKYLKYDVPRREAENQFVSAGMYAKLIEDDASINFVGRLSDDETTILAVVNKKQAVTANEVVQESQLSAEVVVDSLRSLEDKYFVAKFASEHYYSFYNYLQKE